MTGARGAQGRTRSHRLAMVCLLALALVAGSAVTAVASEGGDLVETILKSSKRSERDDAARELAALLEPGPIRKLAKKADTNDRAADALDLVTAALIGKVTTTRNAATRIRAVTCLGVVDTEDSAQELALVAVEDPKRKVRRAATKALGHLDDSGPLVVDTLLEASVAAFGDDRRQGFVEDAIAAIGASAVEPLVIVLATADSDTQIRVIDLLKAIEAEEPTAVEAAWPGVVQSLIAKLSGPESFAVSGLLAEIGEPAVGPLIEVARRHIVTEDPTQDARANAEFALIQMAATDRTLVEPLLTALDTRDLALVADLMNFYIQLGEPGSEPVLIAALNALTDQDAAVAIALSFLDSGHPPLVDAGRAWASAHGFTVTGEPSGQVLWGNLGGDPNT